MCQYFPNNSLKLSVSIVFNVKGLNSKVHEYLEEQLQKMLITRPGYIHHSLQRLRKKNMGLGQNAKRKMSYRGSIRRTRSIHFDNPEMTASVRGNHCWCN